MTIQNKIFDYVTNMFDVQVSNKLDATNSIAAQIATININDFDLNNNSNQTMSILLLGKDKDQLALSDKLFSICNKISKRQKHQHNIYKIDVATPPSLVTQEGEYYIWSCIIEVRYIINLEED